MEDWQYQERWFKKNPTKGYVVEVRRWGKNIWNIYLNFFENFVKYEELTDDWDSIYKAIPNLYFHGGVSFCKIEDKKKVFGCDYNYSGDEETFLTYDNKDDAWQVFKDA